MDRLTAFVAAAHLKLRLDFILRHPHWLERDTMATPNLQGLTKAMDMLEHDLEADAGALLGKIKTVGARGKAAINKGHARIDSVAGRVGEVEKFVTMIEGSNGGAPLDGSSTSSGSAGQAASPKPEPAAAGAPQANQVAPEPPAANVAPVAEAAPAAPAVTAVEPEQLTVNGVSVG